MPSPDKEILDPRDCTVLKEGDVFTRLLAGVVPMTMVVTRVEGELIYAKAWDEALRKESARTAEWTFDRATGAEVDEELKWGPQFGVTGSFIKRDPRQGNL